MEQQQQLKRDTLYWVKFSELEDWTVAEHWCNNVWHVIGSAYQRHTIDFYEVGKEVVM